MRKLASTLLGLLALSGLVYATNTLQTKPAATKHPVKQTLNWTYYSNDIFAKAKKENKTVLLFVESETCYWCQKMKAETFTNQVVINQLLNHFYPVMLDVMTDKSAAQSLGVTSTPVIVYFNAEGKVVKKSTGFVDVSDMLEQMAVGNLQATRTR